MRCHQRPAAYLRAATAAAPRAEARYAGAPRTRKVAPVGAAGVNIYRARNQSITIEEAFTYNVYVDAPPENILNTPKKVVALRFPSGQSRIESLLRSCMPLIARSAHPRRGMSNGSLLPQPRLPIRALKASCLVPVSRGRK